MKRSILISMLLIAMVLFIAKPGITETLPIFYLSFENELMADIAKGESKFVEVSEGCKVVSGGKRGNGLYASTGGAVYYRMKDNFDPDKGTIMFWFKPVDWSGSTDSNSRCFFTGYVSTWMDGMISIFKNRGWEFGPAVYEYTGKQTNGFGASVPSSKYFFDNVWMHITMTWDINKGVISYINGEKKAENLVTWNSMNSKVGDNSWIIFGGHPWGTPLTVDGIMDEIYIYDEPLEEKDIKKYYNDTKSESPKK